MSIIDQISKAPLVRKPAFIGFIILVLCFVGFFLWAAFFPLDSSATAFGRIAVSSGHKTIEHLEGGIVQEIYVHEGEFVKKGQKLILLDKTQSKAKLDIVSNQSYSLLAEEARLIAERDNLNSINFPSILIKHIDDPKIAKMIQGQKNIFEARKVSLNKNISILNSQIGQAGKEITALTSQRKALDTEVAYFNEELEVLKKLEKRKFVAHTRVLQLEREKAEVEGDREQSNVTIIRAKEHINDARLKIVNIKQDRQKEAVEQLRETQAKLANLEERGISASDILKRTLIRSPRAGRVVDLKIHTKGAVLMPGEAMMDIVPRDDPLIVEAHIKPINVDAIYPGLKTKVRLLALKRRHTPTLNGIVSSVSADSFEDKRTGKFYYLAKIAQRFPRGLPRGFLGWESLKTEGFQVFYQYGA